MTRPVYRPWGKLPWLVKHCPPLNWSFFGCLGTEERSLTAWKQIRSIANIAGDKFLRIHDKPSHHSVLAAQRLHERLAEFQAAGGSVSSIRDMDLFSPHHDIVSEVDRFLSSTTGDVAVDITSLPKRFFFPIIRRLVDSTQVNSLIVTYSLPQRYPMTSLAENFNDWAHLPLFTGGYSSVPAEMLIIGVGFQALGLHEHLKGEQGLPIKLLIPFPAPPPSFMRSWELSRQLRRYGSEDMFDVFRADSRDPSDTFDRLLTLSRSGKTRVALAPFGPKPMSLGMCLFATLSDCEVFYTQPSVYHPDYSIGVSEQNGVPEVYGYCLKVKGNSFYKLIV